MQYVEDIAQVLTGHTPKLLLELFPELFRSWRFVTATAFCSGLAHGRPTSRGNNASVVLY